MDLELLELALRKSWSRETCYGPLQREWSQENPAFGQCTATALVVQDYLGGDLIRTKVEGYGWHYYNRLPDGSEVDLTREQFPKDVDMPGGEVRKRSRVLSYKSVLGRYNMLKERLGDSLPGRLCD